MRTLGGARALGLDPKGLAPLIEAFVKSRLARGYGLEGLRKARSMLARLLEHLRQSRIRDMRAVGEASLMSFLARLKAAPERAGRVLSLGTLANWITLLRSFFAFLEKRGVILVSPAWGLTRPALEALPRLVLSEGEARRLMAAPPPSTTIGLRDRAILELLYGSGLRLGECLRLDLVDVDLSEGRIVVRSGKGRKDRVVPLSGRAALALDLYLREARPELARDPREGAVFLSRQAHRLSRARLAAMLAGARQGRGDPQERPSSRAPSCLRHAPAQGRGRRPARPGAARPSAA